MPTEVISSAEFEIIRVDDGATGAQGPKGDPGTNGTNGQDGKDGENAGTNLSPFFSHDLSDWYDANDNENGYWRTQGAYGTVATARANGFTIQKLENGWVHVELDNTSGSSLKRWDFAVKPNNSIKKNAEYTFLLEVRNNESTGSATRIYLVQSANRQFWGNTVVKVLEDSSLTSNTTYNLTAAGASGVKRFVKLSEAANSSHITGDITGMVVFTFYIGAGGKMKTDFRLSVYEGEYTGPYVPDFLEIENVNHAVYDGLQSVNEFDKLTNGGELHGIFISMNGQAYFNGKYLKAEGAQIGGWVVGSNSITIGDADDMTDISETYAEHVVESEYEGEPGITVGGLTYSGDGGVDFDLGSYFRVYMKDSVDDRATADSHNRLNIEPRRTSISGGWSNDNSNTKFSDIELTDNQISLYLMNGASMYSEMVLDLDGLTVNGLNISAAPKEILAFGNYSTLNTDITLTDSYTNFRFILFRFGGGGGNGSVSIYIPTTNIKNEQNVYSTHQALWYVSDLNVANVKFTSNNTIQITSHSGSGSNILRQVMGIY